MNAPVLFVAADPRECEPWVSHWSDLRKLDLPVHWAKAGTLRGQPMMAVANGAGWERATLAVEAAALTAIPRAVYNIGFCGALDESLRIGDVFIANIVNSEGFHYSAGTPTGSGARSGVLVSVARIAQTAAEKRQLRRFGADAVEMEAAGAARASEQLGVPFYCVRVVSDLAGEDFANSFNEYFMPDGRIDLSRLIIGALGSPVKRFGELIRLSKRSALASKNLGEFLVNCTY